MKKYLSLFILMLAMMYNYSYSQMPDLPHPEDKTLSPFFFIESDDPEVDQLPLLETSADVEISGVIADVIVRQVYKNTGKKPIEAIYIFPASINAAVYGMTMTIGERVLVAEVQERGQARQTYEQAKSEGKSTSLLEQQRPNVFQMNVANILPGDTIIVELRYTELLVPTDAVYEFVYPTVVGPRYSNQPVSSAKEEDKFVETPYQKEGEKPFYKFDIKIDLKAGMPLDMVECSSHETDIEKTGSGIARIRLDEDESDGGNRDFVLRYRLAGNKIQTGLLTHQGNDENHFLLMIQPPKRVETQDITRREYIFVVDVSGSMSGYPISISQKLMERLLSTMRQGEKFNVLLFAGGSKLLSETSLEVTKANLDKAGQLMTKQKGGGGTELLPALRRALAIPSEQGYSRSVVIITDGYVSVEKETFDIIRENLDKANFFAFGIGRGVNRYIIEGIARTGLGESFVVMDNNKAEEIADKFREYIESPVMTDIRIEYDGFSVYDTEPVKVPDVFAQRPIIIYGKWKGALGGEIRVTGISGTKELNVAIPVRTFSESQGGEALKYIWARKKLSRLSDYSSIGYEESHKQEITDLGIKYNLLTKHTSFVAVDNLSRTQDTSVAVKQPLPLPDGVSGKALSYTPLMASRKIRVEDRSYATTGGDGMSMSKAPPAPDVVTTDKLIMMEEEPAPDAFIPVEKAPSVNMEDLKNRIIYPDVARRAGIEGRVIIKVLVDKKGKAKKYIIEQSDSEIFNIAASNAVMGAKYTPATQNGKAVMCWVTVPIEFRLESGSSEFKKYEFKEIENGLKYIDVNLGEGDEVLMRRKTVEVKLTFFDKNGVYLNFEKELEFIAGNSEVFKAVDLGVIGMKEDGTRLVAIPPKYRGGKAFPVLEGIGEDDIIFMIIVLEDIK